MAEMAHNGATDDGGVKPSDRPGDRGSGRSKPAGSSAVNGRDAPGNDSTPTRITSNFIARLIGPEQTLLIGEDMVVVGRNSSTSRVDFHVADSSFVSRKHYIIKRGEGNDFTLLCLSKNGLFLDNKHIAQSIQPYQLPPYCTIRFPSTKMELKFENMIGKTLDLGDALMPPGSLGSLNLGKGSGTGTVSSSGSKNLANNATPSSSRVKPTPYSLQVAVPAAGAEAGWDAREDSGRFMDSGYQSPTIATSANNSRSVSPRQGVSPATQNPDEEKPPYSYSQLIVQAIGSSPDKELTLSGIYAAIMKSYPYFRNTSNKGWQNSIRHNLSLNPYFIKAPRRQEDSGKGCLWRLDYSVEAKLIDQSFRKRRQRWSGSRSKVNSAPASPNRVVHAADTADNETARALAGIIGSPDRNDCVEISQDEFQGYAQEEVSDHHEQYVAEETIVVTYASDIEESEGKRMKM
ncbi:forkhead box protein K2-like [Anopheles aquasalis]|uniref:forkhead box protein K2-like n=1 Tax=Anopheles aquasalis TaxID=42839 RepID=UPI00215B5B74|nr:forkhead box protein K2-like [Anopheles aquasalis]